ncbi:MAG: aminotransferase V [Candidatus Binatia bacterium]|nr:MAG: aminotransferase V [Candidatus Binatia bacterium]
MASGTKTPVSAKPFDRQELAEIRAEFPALQRYVYFASNGLGVMPRRAVAAATGVLRKLARDGIVFEIFQARHLVEQARSTVARFLGVGPEEIAFCRNTTEGLLWAAESLPWEPGDEVLIPWGSHPATVLPFLARQPTGLRVRWVRPRAEWVTLDDFQAAWSPRTRAVVLSWVEFHNGFRHDLAGVGCLAHRQNAWLVCDAVQGWGALPFDAGGLPVDVASAGAQKWLLGPPGVGVFYVARAARARMRILHIGAESLEVPDEPSGPIEGYTTAVSEHARCFEEGMRNLPGVAALAASVQWLGDLGTERIAAQIRALSDYLASSVEPYGWRVASPRGGERWSGIILLEPPAGQDAEAWMHRLHREHIAINHRQGCLHLGIHFYNSPDDVDALVRVLAR